MFILYKLPTNEKDSDDSVNSDSDNSDSSDDNNDVSQDSGDLRGFRLNDLEILNQSVMSRVARTFCKKAVQLYEVERKDMGSKFAFYLARNVTDKILFSLALRFLLKMLKCIL